LAGKVRNGGYLVYSYFPDTSIIPFIIECVFLVNLLITIPFFCYFSKY